MEGAADAARHSNEIDAALQVPDAKPFRPLCITPCTKAASLRVEDSVKIFIVLPSGTAAVRGGKLVARSGFFGSQVPGLGLDLPPAAERSPAVASAADVSRDQQRSKTKNSSDDGGRRPHRQPQPTNAATCMEGALIKPRKTYPY